MRTYGFRSLSLSKGKPATALLRLAVKVRVFAP